MRYTYEKINFMVLDKTPIEVFSASRREDLGMRNLTAFGDRMGTFMQDIDDNSHYLFNGIDGKFVEFNTLY